MKKTIWFGGAVATIGGAWAMMGLQADASGLAPQNAPIAVPSFGEEWLLGAGERRVVEGGAHYLDALELGANSALVINGSATLYVARLSAAHGSVIQYQGRQVGSAHDTLTINAIDASKVHFLKIVADGEQARPVEPARSAAGNHGRNATGPSWRDANGRDCSRGDGGASGIVGNPGANAAHVVVSLPMIHEGAQVRIQAIGGNGSTGGSGGDGGGGGDASRTHSGCDGGAGGAAGAGGNGGDSGKITVMLVSDDRDPIDVTRELKKVRVSLAYSAGQGGQPGMPGASGGGGDNKGINSGGNRGPAGTAALAGTAGKGPTQTETSLNSQWANVDVITAQAYRAFLAPALSSRDSSTTR